MPKATTKAHTATTTILAAAILAAAWISSTTGCARYPKTSHGSSVQTLLDFVNTSGSSAKELPGSKAFTVATAAALPPGAHLVVERFDRRVENVYDGAAPSDEDEFLATVGPRLRVRIGLDDTLTDLLFARAEEVVRAAPGPIAVVIVGDGYAEGVTPAGHAAIHTAAACMARNRNLVGVFVVGAEPAARAEIRRDLAPLGNKLCFMELSDDPGAIAKSLEGRR